MLTVLFCLLMAALAWLAAWATWPNHQGAAVLLGVLGGLAMVLPLLALLWMG